MSSLLSSLNSTDHEKKLLPAEDGCTSTDDGGVITAEPPCDSQVVQIPPVVMKRFEPELEVEVRATFLELCSLPHFRLSVYMMCHEVCMQVIS